MTRATPTVAIVCDLRSGAYSLVEYPLTLDGVVDPMPDETTVARILRAERAQ
jgi:hypothetical protein